MSRTYSVRITSLAIGVPVKWLDNLLSHHEVPGVEGGRQGVERRISHEGLIAIEIVRLLTRELGVPVLNAVAISTSALATRSGLELTHRTAGGVAISLALGEIEERLRGGLMDALESAAEIRRGRPRSR